VQALKKVKVALEAKEAELAKLKSKLASVEKGDFGSEDRQGC
jgi:hypothetical protein